MSTSDLAPDDPQLGLPFGDLVLPGLGSTVDVGDTLSEVEVYVFLDINTCKREGLGFGGKLLTIFSEESLLC